MKAPLYRTKLCVPAARAELIARPRLFARLTEGLTCKLMVISAPAGYGKTSLLSAWAAACGLPVAWLSLDESDNDPVRFLTYLTAAFHHAGMLPEPDVVEQMPGMLQSFQSFCIVDRMPVLIDQLGCFAKPFVLVLDDYHLVKHPEIHHAVSLMIDYQPPQMHFAIITREDPPLLLSRLRARGQLLELRQADLRFTPEETAAFLSKWGSVELPASDVAIVASRTEGWVAGLQMAALALQRMLQSKRSPDLQSDTVQQDREKIDRMIDSFGGGHEYIVDYFNTEVFAQQTEAVKSFLLKTSILDQLCGSLCEAVTGQPEGQQMLERLQKANLFVNTLDQERHWYRYHHLFRDLLSKQLIQQSPEMLPELHRRASRWYEENDMIDSAFQHALAGQDQEKIGWILDEYTEACWRRGELTTLSHRIDALTPEQLQDRQEMIIARAMILGQFGNLVEAEQLLSELEQHLIQMVTSMTPTEQIPGMNPVRQPRHLVGLAKAGRAHVAFLREDPQAALIFARQALDHLAQFDLPWDIPWKCQILITMGDAYVTIGDIQSGIQALEEAIPLGKAYHHHALLLEAWTKQAMAYWMQGNLSQADRVCEDGLAYIADNDLGRLPISAGLWIIWGWLQTERNELEPALECLQHGLRLCQVSSQPVFEYFAYAALVRFWLARGDLETAEAFLRPAENLARRRKLPFWQEAILNGLKLLLWVKQGRLAETEQWMTLPEGEILFPYQPLFYGLARLSFARGDLPAAVEILDRFLSQPVQQPHWTRLVWITRARISMQQDNVPQAIDSLSMALSLAARDRCIQIFLDEGEPMALLLVEFVRQRPASRFPEQLLHAFSQKMKPALSDEQRAIREQHVPLPSQVHSLPTKLAGESTAAQGTQNMLDPLSQRELEILSLIADGLSNQEIAARLYISVRTVKFHTSNIYSKLEADSRTEAVAIARRLKMIA